MLILPLHRPLNRKTFPLATAALVLANLLVFFLFQLQDARHAEVASRYYRESGLAALEGPAFARFRAEHVDPLREQMFDEAGETAPALQLRWQEIDPAFRDYLSQPSAFEEAAQRAAWTPLNARYVALRQQVFTERFDLEAAAPGPLTLLSSQFLHGGIDHLLGNLLFLIALGLLVEGALGAIAFLLLYVLGGMAAGLAWAATNTYGGLIGASGAIAALMGAFCVVWGRRQVRFFYWLFVVFDYVRAPALLLLPAWLGWELLQWALSDGSRVAYEAHAGGLVAGALLGLMAGRLGLVRESFVDEDTSSEQADPLQEAQRLLGRLELEAAAAALAAAEQQQPGRPDVALSAAHCALLQRRPAEATARLERLARGAALDAAQLARFGDLVAQLKAQGGALSPAAELAWARSLLARGDAQGATDLVGGWLRQPSLPLPAQALLSLAIRLHEAERAASARELLAALRRWAPGSEQARKAEFLLGEWAAAGAAAGAAPR